MIHLVWTLPALVVIGVIASGRAGTLGASLLGLLTALVVAFATAPRHFALAEAAVSLARGAWIGWIVVPYILGGLLFWQMAIRTGDAVPPAADHPADARARRRLLFAACFLIGPFAESATGFGVGIIGTMALVRKLEVKPIYLIVFSLLSQTMILWGGMGSGAIIAAAFAGTDPTTLTLHSSVFFVAFNLVWLPLYWRFAERAGIGASWWDRIGEAMWLGASLAAVVAATAALGPETAMLAAYGPMIVLRFLVDQRPDRRQVARAARKMLPFVALIGWLVLTRLVPPLHQLLEHSSRIQPFPGTPVWSPFFHAGTWLVLAAVLTALWRGHAASLPAEMRGAWKTGRLAVLTIVTFSMMAEVLSRSGIAGSLAQGLFHSLGLWAIVLTPAISAVFGALANSGNAANGLFMASQVSLAAEAGLSLTAVVALQHAAALSLNIVSPVRMSIVCSLAGTPGQERAAYRAMLPFAAAAAGVLLLAAAAVALHRP